MLYSKRRDPEIVLLIDKIALNHLYNRTLSSVTATLEIKNTFFDSSYIICTWPRDYCIGSYIKSTDAFCIHIS